MAAIAGGRRLREEATAYHWNRLIAQRARQDPRDALPLYKSMQALSVRPNNHTFPSLIGACAALRSRLHPPQIHAHLIRHGLLHSHRHASAALLDAYGKCGLPSYALQLFEEMPQRDVDPFVWTALISSLAVNGLTEEAMEAFCCMRRSDDPECCRNDAVTLSSILSAIESLHCGRMLHGIAIKQGFSENLRLANTLIHMYGQCGAADDAVRCFRCIPSAERDVVSWNSMICGLTANRKNEDALSVFDDMLSAGEVPSRVTLLSVMKSCAQLGCGDTANRIHGYIDSHHPPSPDDVVVLTALVDMHARCGELRRAKQIFDVIEGKNTVSWSAMIAGYEQASLPQEAILIFKAMLEEGIKPSAVTMLSATAACAALGASRPGRTVHKFVVTAGMGNDSRVFSGLIDMYAKCGDLHAARGLFRGEEGVERSLISWTAMIGAEGLHGDGRQALFLFSKMQDQGIKPNDVTFVSLLSACGHSGLVEEGMSCFENMERDHGVTPNAKHYSCVVDLLGRAGRLDQAYSLICRMPMEADLAVWGSLLGACNIHGNSHLAGRIEEKVLGLNPFNAGHRVLLANMYGRAGRMEDAMRVRVELKNDGLRKTAGCTFIEIGNTIYGFRAEDRSHEESELIYLELLALDIKVKDAGYVKVLPSDLLSNHVDVQSNVGSEFHSERLAIAFWILMNGKLGEGSVEAGMGPVRMTKNLRVCKDCHDYTKFVSRVINRELTVRDSRRFHHFRNGMCSCGDYW